MADAGKRFPATVYKHGIEPDVRFTMANERTFLAWIRTALALLAGGVALNAVGLGLHGGLKIAASLLLLLAGLGVAVLAWFAWQRAERALRLGTPLPSSILTIPVVVAVVTVAVLVIFGIYLA